MRGPLGAILLLTATAWGCSDVVILPSDDDGGAGPGGGPSGGFDAVGGASSAGFDAVGGASTGGFDASGGFSTGGAPATGVPGCEVLVSAGDPVLLPTTKSWPTTGRLVALEGERAGVIYDDGTAGSRLQSATIEDPFGAWPPVINAPVIHHDNPDPPHILRPISASRTGTFAVGGSVRGVFAFDQEGELFPFEPSWSQALLRPDGQAAHVIRYSYHEPTGAFRYDVDRLAPFEPDSIPNYEGSFQWQTCKTARATFDGGLPFLVFANDYYCDGLSEAEFFHYGAQGLEETSGGFGLPFQPREHGIYPRPGGGFWYGASTTNQPITIYALDDSGNIVGTPWAEIENPAGNVPAFVPWRDGFVVSRYDFGVVSLTVSDGTHVTAGPDLAPGDILPSVDVSMVVGGEAERSILFAFGALEGVYLARVDCER